MYLVLYIFFIVFLLLLNICFMNLFLHVFKLFDLFLSAGWNHICNKWMPDYPQL